MTTDSPDFDLRQGPGGGPLLEAEQLFKILPHRFPFILIDRVNWVKVPKSGSRVGREIEAIKNVSLGEPYFQGHFPNKPVMPGVLQIEAMAQAAAVSCVDNYDDIISVLIAGVDNARFRKPVLPGDQLVLRGRMTRDKANILSVDIIAYVNNVKVSEAQLMAKFFEKSRP